MRRIFTSFVLATACLAASAKDYTGTLSVTINNGEPATQTTTISVNEADGKYSMSLKNFRLNVGGINMRIGDIDIDNVAGVSNGQNIMLKTSQTITIKKGSEGGLGWVGPTLGKVPVNMTGEVRDDNFYTTISIYMATLKQNILVTFGDACYQVPNGSFDSFHTATLIAPAYTDDPNEERDKATSDEPDNWHSFMSASGPDMLKWLAGYNPVTFKSTDVREGAKGTSVLLRSLDTGLAVANGTITTGRMNTGSWDATDASSNYAWSDITTTDKDDHGDPFYTKLYGRPDAMKVWVKFAQDVPDAEHPYATATAIITDGTLFQEPAAEGVTYANVLGEARNAKIANTEGKWTELTIPFSYDAFTANNVKGKNVLVTFATNADAGKGSKGEDKHDYLYVDDMSFVYNAGLKSVALGNDLMVKDVQSDVKEYNVTLPFDFNEADFKPVSDGAGAYVQTAFEKSGDATKATISVTSNDLLTTNTYVVNIKKGDQSGVVTTGINAVTAPDTAVGIYTIDGVRVSTMAQPGLYIIKSADGTTKKVLKR